MTTLLAVLFSIQFSMAAAPNAAALRCEGAVARPSSGLDVEWTPYKKSMVSQTPEVLADPVVQFALSNDGFRTYLLEQMAKGQGAITDFKQVADAEPLYTQRPSGIDPEKLSYPQLVEYILTNYKLVKTATAHKATFSVQEKKIHHPLREALSRQGLIPSEQPGHPQREGAIEAALQKIHQTWEDLLRKNVKPSRDTLLALPKPYVVAGGRFREAYYWDSFWIMKGLIESGYGSTAKGMLENFVFMFEKYNIIPNGNRYYYLTRTQLPVFMEMVNLLEGKGLLDFKTKSGLKNSLEDRVLKVAQGYYKNIWRGTDRYKPEWGLFGYSDGAGGSQDHSKTVIRPESDIREPRAKEKHSQRVFAESGWDMTYSRFGTDPQNFLPVDLNFMLMGYTAKVAAILQKAGKAEDAQFFLTESRRIHEKLNQYLFDRKTGLYMDRNFANKSLSQVVTAASFFPFYFEGYPKNSSSQGILRKLLETLKPQGHLSVHTTDRPGKGQWDGSWSWAPLNEIAFQALLKYNLIPEAKKLAFDYCVMTLTSFFKHNRTFHEKYRAENGSITLPQETEIYGNEEGFGWTNGTISVFLKELANWGELPALEKEVTRLLETDSRKN